MTTCLEPLISTVTAAESQPPALRSLRAPVRYATHLVTSTMVPIAEPVTVVAAAISEIARNIVDYAGHGEMTLQRADNNGRQGMMIVAEDQGPGIPNVAEAMRYGCASRRGNGVGLPGAKWLMDEFEIVSKPGKGTKVTMRKWLA